MKILVTRSLPSSVVARLQEMGTVDLNSEGSMSADALRQRVSDKDALVCVLTDSIDKSVIDAGSKKKVVANVVAGFNDLDIASARSRGNVDTNTPAVLT